MSLFINYRKSINRTLARLFVKNEEEELAKVSIIIFSLLPVY